MKFLTVFSILMFFSGAASNAQTHPGGKNKPVCAKGENCKQDLWPDFKSECEASGGYATPIPNQCAQALAASGANSNLIYTSIPDGTSPNSKCCIKCKSEASFIGTNIGQRKCENSNGAVWIPSTPPVCCKKPQPAPTPTPTVTATTAVAIKRACFPPTVFVTTADVNPVPTTQATCVAISGYTWGMNACCKNP